MPGGSPAGGCRRAWHCRDRIGNRRMRRARRCPAGLAPSAASRQSTHVDDETKRQAIRDLPVLDRGFCSLRRQRRCPSVLARQNFNWLSSDFQMVGDSRPIANSAARNGPNTASSAHPIKLSQLIRRMKAEQSGQPSRPRRAGFTRPPSFVLRREKPPQNRCRNPRDRTHLGSSWRPLTRW